MFTLNSTVLRFVSSEDSQFVPGAIGVAAILATTAICFVLSSGDKEGEFPKLRGIQLYHAWNFFQRRYDFLQSNFKRNSGKSFSFNILHHNVIVLTGEGARQTFFSHPHFNINEGMRLLLGAVPRMNDVEVKMENPLEENSALFNKMLSTLMSRDRIQSILPSLLQGILDRTNKWGNNGKSGRIDPFTEVYDLVSAMTARLATCEDLSKNDADLKKITELFSILMTSSTPAALLLPWFPSPARKATKEATTKLFIMLATYVEGRRNAEPTNDAIDIMIADGETTEKIVEYIVGMLFAGIASTGIVSCWMLVDLAVNSEWREKCRAEIKGMLSRHLDGPPSATLCDKLGTIPVSVWEGELPTLDACIRETQRISLTTIPLRRHVGEEVRIGGQVVRRGDFLVYPMSEVHMDPEYYSEPQKYDPGRWLRSDPVPNVPYTFLGWGAGRHACTGMRAAKLEMKFLLVIFLMRYDYGLVDEYGKFPNPLPVPNRNDFRQARPLGYACYFDFKEAPADVPTAICTWV